MHKVSRQQLMPNGLRMRVKINGMNDGYNCCRACVGRLQYVLYRPIPTVIVVIGMTLRSGIPWISLLGTCERVRDSVSYLVEVNEYTC
jgi:hypothetical protein